MATVYKTPGVYVEEIPKFPPSIAPVDTAIPAFIGYTEKAVGRDGSDLTRRPQRIESLVEFEQYFGGPQPETGVTVRVDQVTVASLGKPVGITATAAAHRGRPVEAHPLLRAAAVLRQRRASPATSSRSGRIKPNVGDAAGHERAARRPGRRWRRSTSRP